MKQKILFIGKYYPPHSGGIETISKLIFEKINDINQIFLCFSKSKRKNIKKKNKEIQFFKENFNLFSQPISFKFLFIFLKILFKEKKIFIHYPNPLIFLILLFFSKKKIHLFWHSDILNKGLSYQLYKPIEKAIVQRSQSIIVTSKEYLNYSKILKPYRYKIKIINLGIQNKISYKKPRRKINLQKKYILSIGRLVKYKGFEYLIKSMKYLPSNLNLIIIGKGPLKSKLRNLIEKEKLNKRINILNNISDSEKNWIIKNSYIFCLPSINRSEAFGVSLLEAMRHGKPLFTSKINGSGINSVNIKGKTGYYFKPMSPKSISMSINSFIQSQQKYIEISKHCKKIFKEKFNEDIFLNRIKDFLLNIE